MFQSEINVPPPLIHIKSGISKTTNETNRWPLMEGYNFGKFIVIFLF
jgi:hypothetical protein